MTAEASGTQTPGPASRWAGGAGGAGATMSTGTLTKLAAWLRPHLVLAAPLRAELVSGGRSNLTYP